MVFRIPYNVPEGGLWSPVTSTLNWCEEDYYLTKYVAEIVNTVTNFLFVALAYRGIRTCLRNRYDPIFLLSFLGYLIVGIGSFLFHCTLTYSMQLVDELAMIYTTCFMCYAIFAHGKPARYRTLLAGFLSSLCVFITGYYHYIQDPRFHQAAYAILTVTVLGRSLYVMETTLRPRWRNTGRAPVSKAIERAQALGQYEEAEKRDLEILATMYRITAVGVVTFLGAFMLWNVDNIYCNQLRSWRHIVGLPFGLLLEGHGWWHIFSGIGAYIYIIWGILIRLCQDGRQDEIEIHWPSVWTSIPDVNVKRQTSKNSEKQ